MTFEIKKVFALVDCNNFYASCERLFRPELNGKPIVVLSNNDGCIVVRSNEAKALGIERGGKDVSASAVVIEGKMYLRQTRGLQYLNLRFY